MVIVTSYNETDEQTEIQPAPAWGSLYLDITREMGDRWRSQFPALPAPPPTSQTVAETGQVALDSFFSFFNRPGSLE
jgi:hypothetical protein